MDKALGGAVNERWAVVVRRGVGGWMWSGGRMRVSYAPTWPSRKSTHLKHASFADERFGTFDSARSAIRLAAHMAVARASLMARKKHAFPKAMFPLAHAHTCCRLDHSPIQSALHSYQQLSAVFVGG